MIDKKLFQNRLENYFSDFKEEEINGIKYDLRPLSTDIPLIEHAGYDAKRDLFEIIFQSKRSSTIIKKEHATFIEDDKNHLIGIQVTDIKKKNISEVKCEIITDFEHVIKKAKITIEKATPSSLKEFGLQSLEKRKIDFFRNVLEHFEDAVPC